MYDPLHPIQRIAIAPEPYKQLFGQFQEALQHEADRDHPHSAKCFECKKSDRLLGRPPHDWIEDTANYLRECAILLGHQSVRITE
jgi:hypothetical protein